MSNRSLLRAHTQYVMADPGGTSPTGIVFHAASTPTGRLNQIPPVKLKPGLKSALSGLHTNSTKPHQHPHKIAQFTVPHSTKELDVKINIMTITREKVIGLLKHHLSSMNDLKCQCNLAIRPTYWDVCVEKLTFWSEGDDARGGQGVIEKFRINHLWTKNIQNNFGGKSAIRFFFLHLGQKCYMLAWVWC